MQKSAVALSVDIQVPYEQAVARTRELLAEEGFGVMTEIDAKAALKQKLGLDFKPYVILGACNPQLAHQALEANEEVGVLLPCNVVVTAREKGSRVMAFDPRAGMALMDDRRLEQLAAEVATRMKRVLDRLAET